MNTHTIITVIVAIVGCLVACGGVLVRLSNALSEVRHQSDLNKEKIAYLKDSLELAANQLKESIAHSRSRLEDADKKQEAAIERLESRVRALESFLNKSTNFEVR